MPKQETINTCDRRGPKFHKAVTHTHILRGLAGNYKLFQEYLKIDNILYERYKTFFTKNERFIFFCKQVLRLSRPKIKRVFGVPESQYNVFQEKIRGL